MRSGESHLTLYYHPLASYCWKALIALYESGADFEPRIVDLMDAADRAAFLKIAPLGKFPVLREGASGLIIPEATIIIEYLARHRPGPAALLPADPDRARETRLRDRFYDLYVHEPMQKIVTDKLRPTGSNDPHGVELAKAQLAISYGMIEDDMHEKRWAMGEDFTMADCAACPALFYANTVVPFGREHRALRDYLLRLEQRPSFARVLDEAEPYFKNFPMEAKPARQQR